MNNGNHTHTRQRPRYNRVGTLSVTWGVVNEQPCYGWYIFTKSQGWLWLGITFEEALTALVSSKFSEGK